MPPFSHCTLSCSRVGDLTQWERWMEVEHYGAMDRELRFDVYHVEEDGRLRYLSASADKP